MIFSSNKIIKLIKKRVEIAFLFLLLVITATSTTVFNNKKILVSENYKNYRFYWVFFDFLTLLN